MLPDGAGIPQPEDASDSGQAASGTSTAPIDKRARAQPNMPIIEVANRSSDVGERQLGCRLVTQ